MANFQIRFYANSLNRYTSFQMYIPNDVRKDIPQEQTVYQSRKTRTLFLLHGYTGDAGNWVPEYIAQKFPEIFMSCGTEDFLLENNREFHRYLESIGIPHVYLESKGIHDMVFWDEYTIKFAEMMFGGE